MSATPSVRLSDLPARAGQPVTVHAWVTHVRSSGKIAFAALRDGTGVAQAVFVKSELGEALWDAVSHLTTETAVTLSGEARVNPRAPAVLDIGVTALSIVGRSPTDYPIQPKEHGVDFLLNHRHFWLRAPRQVAILRIRAEVEQAIHDFFYAHEFVRCDTPILTAAIGERSGLFSTEYFDEGTAYLAQTGQLYGEALAAALGRIYTFGPTFRAEKSKTRRHLTEFWMIEPEMAWCDQTENMNIQEALVRHVVERVTTRRAAELAVLERDVSRLACVREPFIRLPYGDAVTLARSGGSDVQWGDDLGAPDEALIVAAFERPVFVMNYPKGAKAFYMKENPGDPRTVLCSDLLAPEGRGEIIGGSQREDDHDRLHARIVEEGLPLDAYGWYLDLRKYGSFVHSGFGLGLERMVAWIAGIDHIREVIPFPRMMDRLRP